MLTALQLSVALFLFNTLVMINSQGLNTTRPDLLRAGRIDAGLAGGRNLQNGQFLQISNSDLIPVSVKREGAESWSAVRPLQERRMTRLLVPVKRHFPVYYRIYRYPNGRIVRIPIIYRFYRVVPPGIRGAIRTRRGDGWLVPIPVLVLNRDGRLVYNPVVYTQFMAMIHRGFTLSTAYPGLEGEIGRNRLPLPVSQGESIRRRIVADGSRFSTDGAATTEELRNFDQTGASGSAFFDRVDQNIQAQNRETFIQPAVRTQTISRTERRLHPTDYWRAYWYRYNQQNRNIDPRLRTGLGVPAQSGPGTGFPLPSQGGSGQVNVGGDGIWSNMDGRRQLSRTQTFNDVAGAGDVPTVDSRGTDLVVPEVGTTGTGVVFENRGGSIGTDRLVGIGGQGSTVTAPDVGFPGTGIAFDERNRLEGDRLTGIGGQDSTLAIPDTGIPGSRIVFDERGNLGTDGITSTGGQDSFIGNFDRVVPPGSPRPNIGIDMGGAAQDVLPPDSSFPGGQTDIITRVSGFPEIGSPGSTNFQPGIPENLPGGIPLPSSTLIPPRPTGFTPVIPAGRTLFPGRDIIPSDTHTHTITHTREGIPFNGPPLTGSREVGFTDPPIFDTGIGLGSGPMRPTDTYQPIDGSGVIGVVTDTATTSTSTFPGGISDPSGFGEVVSTGINEGSFNGQRVSPLEDPITGLPIGFVPQDPVRIGTAPESRIRFTGESTPIPGSATTSTTELVGVPPALASLLNDHALLEYLNQLLATGDVLKFRGQQDRFKIPLAILEILTKPEVTAYLNYLITALNQQRAQAIEPRPMPTDLLNLLESQFFIDFMNKRRDGGAGILVDVKVRETRRDPLSTFAVTMNGSNDTLIMEGMNGGLDQSDIFIPGLDKSQIQIVPFGQDNLQGVLTDRGGSDSDIPVLPVLPSGGLNQGGTIIPVGVVTEVLPIELCMGCKIDGGLGYTNHPSRCDLFVVCYPGPGKNFIPMAQQCPYGLFWSQATLTCKLSKDVHCPHEVCRDQPNKYQYAHKDNCRAYWECQEGYSAAHCCPEGMEFFDGIGCRISDTCNTPCPPNKDTNEELLWSGACDKRDVLEEPTKYERHVHAGLQRDMFGNIVEEWVLQECPPGTIFRKEICDCSMSALEVPHYEYEGHVCKPEVYMPFDKDLFDKSIQRTHVRVDNVTRTGGAACFNGRSALAIPKYANMDYGTYFYAVLKYKHGNNDDQTQALLYNGDCAVEPSMVLGSKPDGNMFSVKTTTGQVHTLFAPSTIQPTDWRTVSIMIDGHTIELKNDQFTETHKISGGIARSQCGMKIGWGDKYKNFVGCIDEFKLYRCRPDEYPKKRDQVFPEIRAMNGGH